MRRKDNNFKIHVMHAPFDESTKTSIIYMVHGYGGYTGNESDWCPKAYRLKDSIIQPAFVFDGFEYEESIRVEVLFDDDELKDEIFYYNDKDFTIYIKEGGDCHKYAWNRKDLLEK